MRCLSLVAATLLLLGASVARADTTDDLRRPSSTVPGCANDWGPLGAGSGWVEPTCEAKAALAEWDAHAAAVNLARDTLVGTTDLPAERTDPRTVVGALDAAAAAVDAMARLYDPAAPQWGDFADVLAWMGVWGASERKTDVRPCRATCRRASILCDIHLRQKSAWSA